MGSSDPQFLADVETVIRDAYFGEPLFLENQSVFNFWIAGEVGRAGTYDGSRSEDRAGPDTCSDGVDNGNDGLTDENDPSCTKCTLTAPGGWYDDLAFADGGGILHTDPFRDCASPNKRLFSIEASELRTVIHETAHSPFGLADEYCCDTAYFEPAPLPNLYRSLANCESDTLNVGRTASDCRQLSKGTATVDWWTSDPPSNDLMVDNTTPQKLDLRRINWMFNNCEAAKC